MVIWSAPKSTAKQSDKEASVAVRNDVIGNAMTANSRCRPRPPVLLRQDKDGIATLTLNRPGRLNALSLELLRALLREFEAMAEDKSPRLVVLAANGEAFCAGHDLEEIRGTGNRRALKALFDECSKTMLAITRIPPPVIARVHGIATAAGCQLVAMCDLAVAAEEARFATSGVNLGLFCSTPMVALTRNLPRKQAMEMLLTGDFIDAETALRYGLVNRVVPAGDLDEAVAELAGKVAGKSPAAVAFGKRLFYRQIEAGIEEAYALAADTMAGNMMTEDARDGIDAFMEKRPAPEWKDR
jgi:enoyl-CoA hydratase/carnithine racemase